MIGVGEYRKEDYSEILQLSEDKDNMEKSWKEWKANKNNLLLKFKEMKIRTIDVVVKPKDLVRYCRERGLRINGKSRANFISFMVSKLNEK